MNCAPGFDRKHRRPSLKRKPEGDLQRVEFLWPRDVVAAVERYGVGQHLDRTAAALELVRRSLEGEAADDDVIAWRGSGAHAQLDSILDDLVNLDYLIRSVAMVTFGLDELLRDWVLRTGVLKVSDEDLLHEVRRAGWNEFESLLRAFDEGLRSPWDGMFPDAREET